MIKKNMEIPAYPSSEYGYFMGTIDTISKDIKVDQSGSAYYVMKVCCVTTTVANKKGDAGSIKNGVISPILLKTYTDLIIPYILIVIPYKTLHFLLYRE